MPLRTARKTLTPRPVHAAPARGEHQPRQSPDERGEVDRDHRPITAAARCGALRIRSRPVVAAGHALSSIRGRVAVVTTAVTMQAAVAAATAELADRYERGVVNERTATLYRRHLETFGRYLAAHDVTLTSEVTGRIVDAWVDAPISAVSPGSRGRAGQNPAEATRRNRQVSIRWALEVWAASGWIQPEVVPTRTLGRTASQAPCPVLPAEARRLRVAGQHSPADTLLPALVALGLSGLNHTEIARLTLDSYDPDTGRLTVVGRGGRRTREIALDPVARRPIDAHVRALHKVKRLDDLTNDPARCPLSLPTAPRTHRREVTGTAVGQHLYRAVAIAGITRDGVTPGSLQEYAANACYARTNRIEDVATLLGLVSLDAAMRLIDRDWQRAHAATIREQQD